MALNSLNTLGLALGQSELLQADEHSNMRGWPALIFTCICMILGSCLACRRSQALIDRGENLEMLEDESNEEPVEYGEDSFSLSRPSDDSIEIIVLRTIKIFFQVVHSLTLGKFWKILWGLHFDLQSRC